MRRTGFTLSITAPIVASSVLATIAIASPEGRYVSGLQHVTPPAGRYVSEVVAQSSPAGRYVFLVEAVSVPEGRYVSDVTEIARVASPEGRYVAEKQNSLSLYQIIARLFQ